MRRAILIIKLILHKTVSIRSTAYKTIPFFIHSHIPIFIIFKH